MMRRDQVEAVHSDGIESLERALWIDVQTEAMQLGVELKAPEGKRYNKRDVLAYCVARLEYGLLDTALKERETHEQIHRLMTRYQAERLEGRQLVHVHVVMRNHLADVGRMLEDAGFASIRAAAGYNRPLLCFISLMLTARSKGMA